MANRVYKDEEEFFTTAKSEGLSKEEALQAWDMYVSKTKVEDAPSAREKAVDKNLFFPRYQEASDKGEGVGGKIWGGVKDVANLPLKSFIASGEREGEEGTTFKSRLSNLQKGYSTSGDKEGFKKEAQQMLSDPSMFVPGLGQAKLAAIGGKLVTRLPLVGKMVGAGVGAIPGAAASAALSDEVDTGKELATGTGVGAGISAALPGVGAAAKGVYTGLTRSLPEMFSKVDSKIIKKMSEDPEYAKKIEQVVREGEAGGRRDVNALRGRIEELGGEYKKKLEDAKEKLGLQTDRAKADFDAEKELLGTKDKASSALVEDKIIQEQRDLTSALSKGDPSDVGGKINDLFRKGSTTPGSLDNLLAPIKKEGFSAGEKVKGSVIGVDKIFGKDYKTFKEELATKGYNGNKLDPYEVDEITKLMDKYIEGGETSMIDGISPSKTLEDLTLFRQALNNKQKALSRNVHGEKVELTKGLNDLINATRKNIRSQELSKVEELLGKKARSEYEEFIGKYAKLSEARNEVASQLGKGGEKTVEGLATAPIELMEKMERSVSDFPELQPLLKEVREANLAGVLSKHSKKGEGVDVDALINYLGNQKEKGNLELRLGKDNLSSIENALSWHKARVEKIIKEKFNLPEEMKIAKNKYMSLRDMYEQAYKKSKNELQSKYGDLEKLKGIPEDSWSKFMQEGSEKLDAANAVLAGDLAKALQGELKAPVSKVLERSSSWKAAQEAGFDLSQPAGSAPRRTFLPSQGSAKGQLLAKAGQVGAAATLGSLAGGQSEGITDNLASGGVSVGIMLALISPKSAAKIMSTGEAGRKVYGKYGKPLEKKVPLVLRNLGARDGDD